MILTLRVKAFQSSLKILKNTTKVNKNKVINFFISFVVTKMAFNYIPQIVGILKNLSQMKPHCFLYKNKFKRNKLGSFKQILMEFQVLGNTIKTIHRFTYLIGVLCQSCCSLEYFDYTSMASILVEELSSSTLLAVRWKVWGQLADDQGRPQDTALSSHHNVATTVQAEYSCVWHKTQAE